MPQATEFCIAQAQTPQGSHGQLDVAAIAECRPDSANLRTDALPRPPHFIIQLTSAPPISRSVSCLVHDPCQSVTIPSPPYGKSGCQALSTILGFLDIAPCIGPAWVGRD